MITKEEVLKLLEYDPVTGIFRWKTARRGVKFRCEAGCIMVTEKGKSYRQIRVNKQMYLAHRLVWLVLTGKFPDEEIDHIDGNGINNAASNLRAVTHAENCKNQRKRADNTSGSAGVSWDKARRKWAVRIHLNGKDKHLGRFDDFDDAVAVRKKAERKLGFHPRHGETRPL